MGDAKLDTMEKVINGLERDMREAPVSALPLDIVRYVVVPNARADSKRVMMFITDGGSNLGGPLKRAAKYLREQEDFEIFAIGKIMLA